MSGKIDIRDRETLLELAFRHEGDFSWPLGFTGHTAGRFSVHKATATLSDQRQEKVKAGYWGFKVVNSPLRNRTTR